MDGSTRVPEDTTQAAAKQRTLNQWVMVGVGLTGVMSVMAIIVSLVALGSTSSANNGSPTVAASSTAASTPAAKPEPASLKLTVKTDAEHGKLGPGRVWHDAFLPAMLKVKPGQTVSVTVYNYDNSPHTFTAPTLGINEVIAATSSSGARATTFKFTAPSQNGTYQWWCSDPCDPWAMGHQGYMQGTVTVGA